MARLFVKANPDKIEHNGTAPVNLLMAPGITLAGWCYPTVASQTMIVCGVGTGASGFGVVRIGLGAGNIAFAHRQDDSGAFSVLRNGTTPTTINQWQHIAGTFTALSPITVEVFYNGITDGSSSGTISVTSLTRTAIGENAGNLGAGSRAWSGSLAEIGMWQGVLDAAEIAALAKGVSPILIRPTALVFYAPLVRDLQDVRGGLALTATGTSVSVHPRVFAAVG